MNVFISHAAEDRQVAGRLAAVLEKGGHKVWTDRELLPGDNFMRVIQSALEDADALVALVSPRALASDWVKREWEYALGQEKFAGRLIPVVVGEARPQDLEDAPWIFDRLYIRGATATEAGQRVMRLLGKPRGARARGSQRASQ